MTRRTASAIRASVRKVWLLLLLCLIASSLVATTTVHAREWIGEISLECSGTVHSDGDADQTQGDSDKSAPHHHGSCHGHVLDVLWDAQESHSFATRDRVSIGAASALRARTVDPTLRPPAA